MVKLKSSMMKGHCVLEMPTGLWLVGWLVGWPAALSLTGRALVVVGCRDGKDGLAALAHSRLPVSAAWLAVLVVVCVDLHCTGPWELTFRSVLLGTPTQKWGSWSIAPVLCKRWTKPLPSCSE